MIKIYEIIRRIATALIGAHGRRRAYLEKKKPGHFCGSVQVCPAARKANEATFAEVTFVLSGPVRVPRHYCSPAS